MEEIYEQNMEILKRATSKATQDVLKLYDLPYFDKKNYEENKSTLKFILALGDEGEFLSDDQVAIYVASTNSIYLKDSLLHKTLIDEEVLRMILLHELIHMASTDRKKGRVGFETDAFPITYNEGCTQFLTLKVLDKKIEENIMYPESTKYVKEVIGDEYLLTIANSAKASIYGKYLVDTIEEAKEMYADLNPKTAVSVVMGVLGIVGGLTVCASQFLPEKK